MSKTYVIAEMGSCHDMNRFKAAQMIEVAKDAGADAVKAQYWSSAARMAKRRNAPAFLQTYTDYAISLDFLQFLAEESKKAGIDFMCSAYLPEDVEVVAPLVKMFKIASFEANDPQLLVAHIKPMNIFANRHKRVVISMGLGATPNVIDEHLRRHLSEDREIRIHLLLCVSSYPAPLVDLNLSRLSLSLAAHPLYSGFSDHAGAAHTFTGAVAVAAGARIIERHFRSDSTSPDNPDFAHAMDPAGFSKYVKHIRFAELCLGDPYVNPEPASERPMRAYRVRD